MTAKTIVVNGEVFPCPIGWSVDQAEAKIRYEYSFQRGGIRQNGVAVLGHLLIGSLTGTLVYVGGSSTGKEFFQLCRTTIFPVTSYSFSFLSASSPVTSTF